MKNLEFVKKTFRDRFVEIYDQFEDKRELLFPENKEGGIFPHFLFKEGAQFQENWTEEIIEIRFNEELIKSHILGNSEWDLQFIENHVKQIANHEYGHTITLKTVFLLYPRDTRYILMDKDIRDITEDDRSRCFKESNCILPEFFSLRNVDLQYFEEIFLDYWANIKVRDEIDENSPEQCIDDRIVAFQGLKPKHINPKTSLDLLLYSQLFFIYYRWIILEEIMRESNLDQLLIVYKSVNSFFDKIIKFNENFDFMEEDLVILARILDNLNYQELIFENRLTTQDRRKLRDFINRHLRKITKTDKNLLR